jgi:hypothetical protein
VSPELGANSPVIIRNVEVLPAPLMPYSRAIHEYYIFVRLIFQV